MNSISLKRVHLRKNVSPFPGFFIGGEGGALGTVPPTLFDFSTLSDNVARNDHVTRSLSVLQKLRSGRGIILPWPTSQWRGRMQIEPLTARLNQNTELRGPGALAVSDLRALRLARRPSPGPGLAFI